MRLGQLARKLALKPIEIVGFLAKQNVLIEDGGNTKLEDDHVKLILQKFAPEHLEAPRPKAEPIIQIPATPIVVENEVVAEVQIPTNESREEETIELIKAPKVELSGLKVLGKIELPEPKKKEPAPESTDEPDSGEIKKQPLQDFRKLQPPRHERTNTRARKNPIAVKREEEALEGRKKREAEVERKKDKRTLHYMKKVIVAKPTKAIKMTHDEPSVEESVVEVPAPKTWWGRFMRWLNT